MKIPEIPPIFNSDFIDEMGGNVELIQLLLNPAIKPCDSKGRYQHWEKLKHLDTPKGYTSELYWHATKFARDKISRSLPFVDKHGNPFNYCLPDTVLEQLLWVSSQATGAVADDPKITDPKTRRTYLINSLIEEAINSSQLEGAATTRAVAKEMIRTERKPKDKSEQMILNNYTAMRFISEFIDDQLTPSMVFELHKILTNETLEEGYEYKAGVFRSEDDDICVEWDDGTTLHVPPPANELKTRLDLVCGFANGVNEEGNNFIPPIIRAIVVHFMIGYDHPFYDGNGRTARALFYWVMAKSGFWLMEYVSISRVIKSKPGSYMKAYLHTETDSNDVTYFIVHQLAVVKQAIEDLHGYLIKKTEELQSTETALSKSPLQGLLNHRQLTLVRNAMQNPGAQYTVKSHQKSHGVALQTARTDLLRLSDDYGVLRKLKEGKTDVFVAPKDLLEVIKRFQRQST